MTTLDIFISSKVQELAAERQALYDLLPTLGKGVLKLHAWVFEKDAPASGKTIRQVYLDALRDSGLYIGLFWNQYGEWTIDEFDRAAEWGIERHIYVKDVDADQRDPRLKDFLEKHGNVEFGVTAKWFKTTGDLREAVRQSLDAWMQEFTSGPPGDLSARLYRQPAEVLERADRLIGRESLVAEVRSALDQNKRTLLQGLGGTGKTALAAEIAAGWMDAGKGAALWVRAGRHKPDALFDALARTFDAHLEIAKLSGDARIQAVRHLLAKSGATLLVIDDVWNGAALEQAVKAAPADMRLLVTSRQRYPLAAIVKVGELARPAAVETLSHYAAHDWHTDAKANALCQMLGDLAFALRVAGLTLAVDGLTPGELLERIGNSPANLEMPSDFFEEGRASVAALLEVSLHALDEDTQRTFLTFGSLFAPRATPELLSLCLSIEEGHTDRQLISLQRRGLVERTARTDDTAASYAMHDLAYSYARAQASDDQRGKALDACLVYTDRYKTPSLSTFAALRPELDNFMGAADWAMKARRYAEVERFAWNLYRGSEILALQGYPTQAIQLLAQAAEAAEKRGDMPNHGTHLGNLGLAYDALGQYDRAIDHHQEALTIACEIGDRQGEGQRLNNLGIAYRNMGQYIQAIDHYQKALNIAREISDRRGEGNDLANLGIAYADLGQYTRAIEYHRQALTIAREIEDRHGEGSILGNLGNAYVDLGQYEQAIKYHQQALAINREIGHRRSEGNNLGNLGTAYNNLGQYVRAIEHYQEALAIACEIGDRRSEGSILGALGNVYANLGQYEQAIEYYEEALVIAREIGDRHGENSRLGNLGTAYADRGQYETAIEYFEKALLIAREIGDRLGEGIRLHNLASAYFSLEQYDRVIEYFQQARVIFVEAGAIHLVKRVDDDIAKAQAKIGG